jgi:hypothetical protein
MEVTILFDFFVSMYVSNRLDAFANYKGVMMCTRPQDKASIFNERPFCSMVTPGTELGVNPDKPGERKHNKRNFTNLCDSV